MPLSFASASMKAANAKATTEALSFRNSRTASFNASPKPTPIPSYLLNAGGNVDMQKWISKIPALVHIWYAGQEGGTAIAEILFGKTNPSGKLPVSFEKDGKTILLSTFTIDPSNSKRVAYKEGIFMGYPPLRSERGKTLVPIRFRTVLYKFQIQWADSYQCIRFCCTFCKTAIHYRQHRKGRWR